MGQIKQTTFSRIGNLAFYDGWNCDYVYFNTLRKANEYYITKNGPGSWDPMQASPIAQQAINDASSHEFLKNNSAKDSNNYFEERFTTLIIPFLEKAYAYERKNERAWINTKVREIQATFNNSELPIIKQLITMIKNAENGIDYDEMTTLINVILQGTQNTKITADYEEKRIGDINATLTRLIRSRKKQTAGLLESQHKSLERQTKGSIQSAKRLWTRIEDEYLKTGQLSRKINKTSKKYVLFGGKQFEKINPTIDNVIKNWAQAVMQDITQNPQVISQIMTTISKYYALERPNNLKLLEPRIRKIIALAVLQYGMNNLSTLLDKSIDEIAIKEIEQDLINDNKLFDTAKKLSIGIEDLTEERLGYKIASPKLLEETEHFTEMYTKSAEQLFTIVDTAIQRMTDKELEQSTFVTILNNPAHKGVRNWDKTKQVFELIHSVEAIQTEMDKMSEEYKKSKENIIKQVHLPQNTNALITISIINGEVQVDQTELVNAIKNTEVYKDIMQFKEFSPKTLSRTIATLKRNASIHLREDLINSIKAGVYKIDPDDLVRHLKDEIQTIDVKMNGPDVSEILGSMQFKTVGNAFVIHMGPQQTKNDILAIEFQYQDLVTAFSDRIKKFKLSEKKYGNIEKKYTEAQQNFYKELYQTVASTAKAANQPNTDDRYSSMIGTLLKQADNLQIKAWDDIQKLGDEYVKYLNEMIAPKDREQAIKRYQDFTQNFLKNSFFVSTTVKTYNTYTNQIGFLGGSLGSTLDTQLTTIADIFDTAGIKLDESEIKWMKFAILNCFEGSILKETNKNIIENYLGALMAFALFDEGGAESALISNFYKTYFQSIEKIDSPKILHLYRVDSIYVPGSIIIKRTLDSLKNEVLPAIQTKIPRTMKRGAGVTIINNTTEKVIPNRPIKKHVNSPKTNAWAIAGQEAKKKIKLQIVFLAGLLDIVKGINKTLGNIDIPQ